MLSILIPVYNYTIIPLVQNLSNQSIEAGIDFEILVIDDASHKSFQLANKSVEKIKNVRYLLEPDNIGRSKIRNKLADLAKYENLLFMDCDSQVVCDDYIKKYIPYLNSDMVVSGGTIYSDNPPDSTSLRLRWLQGRRREQIDVQERSIFPNKSFMTNNFLISKNIFDHIRFDENIVKYGHEDTLFGYELQKNNIIIKHIDNPLEHIGLEASKEYLEKTKISIQNLMLIMSINGNEKRLVKDIKLLKYYKIFQKLGLGKLIGFLFRKSETVLYKNLTGDRPSLFAFDIYKLGYINTLN